MRPARGTRDGHGVVWMVVPTAGSLLAAGPARIGAEGSRVMASVMALYLGFRCLSATAMAGGPTTAQVLVPPAPDGVYPPGAVRAVVGPDRR